MIQKKKFVKTFRNTKTVQLVLLLLLEAAYVLVLTLNPALGTKLFEDRTLFILCTLSWILALFNLIWLLYDFYKLRTFAEESHALNRAAFLDHLTGKLGPAPRAEFCLRMAAINLCGSGLVLLPVIAVVTVV